MLNNRFEREKSDYKETYACCFAVYHCGSIANPYDRAAVYHKLLYKDLRELPGSRDELLAEFGCLVYRLRRARRNMVQFSDRLLRRLH